jgi:hypothetical protein
MRMIASFTLMMVLGGSIAAQDFREANLIFCAPLLRWCGAPEFEDGLREKPLALGSFRLGCNRALIDLKAMCDADPTACDRISEKGKFRIALWGMQAEGNRRRDARTCLRWFQTGEWVGGRMDAAQ